MKTIILVFLLSVITFGQSGKSNLTQQQKDSINAMIDAKIDTSATIINLADSSNVNFYNELNETATLGTEKLTNNSFTSDLSSWTAGTGWAYGNGGAQHTTGNTATLTQGISVTSGEVYAVNIGLSNYTNIAIGTVSIQLGSLSSAYTIPFAYTGTYYDDLTFAYKATSTTTLTFTVTPTTNFDGTIDSISIKKITGTSTSVLNFYNTLGELSAQLRFDSTLSNTFVGTSAGQYNLTGFNNTVFGKGAFQNNISGNWNVAIGNDALHDNLTSYGNVAIGQNALYKSILGRYSTAVGYDCLGQTTIGAVNVAYGLDALYKNISGSFNTAIGAFSLWENTTAQSNVGVGYFAGGTNVTGQYSLSLGNYAGYGSGITKYDSCTFIGNNSGTTANNVKNSTALGYGALVDKSNQIVIGRSNIEETKIYGDEVIVPNNLTINGELQSGSLMAGNDSFSGTSTKDTVLITNADITDIYSITLLGDDAPSANDFYSMRRVSGGFILNRSSSGTSNLGYMWTRTKSTPQDLSDSLAVGLIAYWNMNEASGDRSDKVGFNGLTDVNSVGSTDAGILDSAAVFDSTSQQYLEHTDDPVLSMGSLANGYSQTEIPQYTFAFWVKFDDLTAREDILAKWDTTGNQREYSFIWNYNSSNKLRFFFSWDGSSTGQGYVQSDTAFTTGKWYFIVGWYAININNTTLDTMYIQVDNGTKQGAEHLQGIYDGTSDFKIGASDIGNYSDVEIDEVGIWRRVLNDDERTYLYNSGLGRTYSNGKIQ